jgi:hypothetical protein
MMKKMLLIVAANILVLFISACTVQHKEACYVNEEHNRPLVPQTHLYNSQVPVKNQNLNINRQNSSVPTSTGSHTDKYQMNPSSGTDSTGPK